MSNPWVRRDNAPAMKPVTIAWRSSSFLVAIVELREGDVAGGAVIDRHRGAQLDAEGLERLKLRLDLRAVRRLVIEFEAREQLQRLLAARTARLRHGLGSTRRSSCDSGSRGPGWQA